MANSVDSRDIEAGSLSPKQPAESAVLMGLAPISGRPLIKFQAVAIAACPSHIAVGNLHGTGGTGKFMLGKLLIINIQQPETRAPPLGKDRIALGEQRGHPFDFRMNQYVFSALQAGGKFINTTVSKQHITIREPDPVGP